MKKQEQASRPVKLSAFRPASGQSASSAKPTSSARIRKIKPDTVPNQRPGRM